MLFTLAASPAHHHHHHTGMYLTNINKYVVYIHKNLASEGDYAVWSAIRIFTLSTREDYGSADQSM